MFNALKVSICTWNVFFHLFQDWSTNNALDIICCHHYHQQNDIHHHWHINCSWYHIDPMHHIHGIQWWLTLPPNHHRYLHHCQHDAHCHAYDYMTRQNDSSLCTYNTVFPRQDILTKIVCVSLRFARVLRCTHMMLRTIQLLKAFLIMAVYDIE